MSKEDPNPFEILGLEPTFDIDMAVLDEAYFSRQTLTHPDRFVYHANSERQAASLQASLLNQAYETLKNPALRARVLLKLRGINVAFEEEKTVYNTEILEEMMDLQEAVMEAISPHDLTDVDNQIHHRFQVTMTSFAHALKQNQNQMLPGLFLRLTYLSKLKMDLKVRQRQLSAKVPLRS